jgi:peptidoglycan/xylan/chitin deacetylase (PgdA/CDA1 family)
MKNRMMQQSCNIRTAYYAASTSGCRTIYGKQGIGIRLVYLGVSLLMQTIISLTCCNRKKRVILCYHGVTADQAGRFCRQIARIARRVASEENDSVSISTQRRETGICVTFDDAFENLLKNALPALEKYQISAMVFAVAGNLGRRPDWQISPDHPDSQEQTMTEDQLKTLCCHPLIRIGSHTLSHPTLTALPPMHIKTELVESKKRLESLLNCQIEDLALPHGAYDEAVLQIAYEADYRRVYTLEPKLTATRDIEEGTLGRFSMSPDVWPIEFVLTCTGAYAWLGPWRAFLHHIKTRLRRICSTMFCFSKS